MGEGVLFLCGVLSVAHSCTIHCHCVKQYGNTFYTILSFLERKWDLWLSNPPCALIICFIYFTLRRTLDQSFYNCHGLIDKIWLCTQKELLWRAQTNDLSEWRMLTVNTAQKPFWEGLRSNNGHKHPHKVCLFTPKLNSDWLWPTQFPVYSMLLTFSCHHHQDHILWMYARCVFAHVWPSGLAQVQAGSKL